MALVLKQALDAVVTDVATLAAASLMPQGSQPYLTLLQSSRDWNQMLDQRGTHVCWTDDFEESEYLSTSDRDAIGYRIMVISIRNKTRKWDDRVNDMTTLQQNLQRHFNHRRRMASVSDTGTNQLVCRVKRGIAKPNDVNFDDYDVRGITVIAWFLEPRLAQ